MASGTCPPDDERLYEVLAGYLDAFDNGSSPDRATLVASHPELAGPLSDYFAAADAVSTHAAEFLPRRQPASLQFSSYEVFEEIGSGGMGVVYRARQKSPDRIVALKMIRAGLLAASADVRRFRTEAESAARLDHPNIVQIHEIGERDGQLFFSMKYCSGGSLTELAPGGRPAADLRAAVRIVATIARAVHHAHQRGILHRDLKPSNILLDEVGRPYVADFGLAKILDRDAELTASGAILGTPGYLAPEMVPAFHTGPDGPPPVATTAVDVYGLGTILYFLLTGRPPFRGQTLTETLTQAQSREPASPRQSNPSVDRDLAAVCLVCLEKPPARRYSSAEALAEDLDRWLAGQPTRARPVGRLTRLRRWVYGNPVAASLAALVVLSAGGGLTALGLSYRAVVAERETSLRSQRETAEYAEHLRARVYPGDILLAHGLLQRGELTECRAILDRYLPDEGKADLRGWEWHYLDRLLHAAPREVSRYQGKTGSAYHSAFSPDGTIVASAWENGGVHLWDRKTGQSLRTIWAHSQDANWVAFVGDGSRVASAGDDGAIRVWEVRTGTRVGQEMKANTQPVESIAVSPDGKLLVSGGRDGVFRVWDLNTQKLLHERTGHQKNIEGVALSPDGHLAATASYDGTVRLWESLDSETGPRQVWANETDQNLHSVAFSPDGGRLAVGQGDSSTIELSVLTGEVIARSANSIGTNRGVSYIPGDPNAVLIVGDDGGMRTWDSNRNDVRSAVSTHRKTAWSVSCSRDGRFAVTSSSDSTARVWDLRPGPVQSLKSVRGGITYLRRQPTGLMFQSAPNILWRKGERSWSIAFDRSDSPGDWPPFTGAHHPATAISNDGKLIAFARVGNSVEIRNRAATTALTVFDRPQVAPTKLPVTPGGGVIDLTFLPGDHRLAILYQDGTLALTPLDGQPPTYHPRAQGDETLIGLTVVPSLGLGVVSYHRFRILDLHRNEWLEAESRVPSVIRSFAVSPTSDRVALGLASGGVKIFSIQSGREETSLSGHIAAIEAVAFTPDGKTLATACADGVVRLWNATTGQEYFVIEDRRGRDVTSIAFAPDGRFLVAGGAARDGHTVTVHDPGRPPD